MFSDFIISYKLKNTYRVNGIIYSLKHTPLINKLFCSMSYRSKGLKIFANIISFLIEFVSIFIWKFVYFFIFFVLIIPFYSNMSSSFINIFFFLTIIGGYLNSNMYNPTIDNYYALELLRFNPKKYILCNYIYFLIKTIVGLLPFSIIFGLNYNISLLTCFIMPLFVVSVKNIFNIIKLNAYKVKKIEINENKLSLRIIVISIILLVLAYGLPYISFGVNEIIFDFLFFVIFIVGLVCIVYLFKNNNYRKMSKNLLLRDDMINAQTIKEDNTYKNIINNDVIISNKSGYAYLNDLFVQRHKKLLTKPSKNITIGIIVFFVIVSLLCIVFPNKNNEINDILKNSLPYFLFIMYFINRGQKICQAMFMNCDHSMLTYRFYKQPNSILSLFKERLKTLIKLNVLPGIFMANGVVILLRITGGASNYEYFISFACIISMSIFFSIHYLVLYYLLQPYDINLSIKNPLFTSICGITYFVCFMGSQIQIPTSIFGLVMCLFTIVYSVAGLYLSYKYAYKTFKLRV